MLKVLSVIFLCLVFGICHATDKMVIGYFPNWLYANYPVEQIPFKDYTHINYAFAILNNPDNLPSFADEWVVESSFPKLVELAHADNTKVLLSIGGWTGSKRFSPMVASKQARKKFIDWNIQFIDKYNTDGVDIDWEYPGRQAAGCNEYADDDAKNLLLLLKELRAALDAKYPDDHKEISMAVYVEPFTSNGESMTDVSEYVPYFDHINLMAYDINGAWADLTGPNAPFRAEQGKGAQYSFVQTIRNWKDAGVPAEKLTAGMAYYGRAMQASVDMRASKSQYQQSVVGAPKGDSDDAYWADPFCPEDIDGLSGIWKWKNLRSEGLIKDDFISAGKGWVRHWDNVTQTPWLFNPSSKTFISYDDPQSLRVKVKHALCEDLAGVMVWDLHQDNGELVKVVNEIHGKKPASCPLNEESLSNGESDTVEDESTPSEATMTSRTVIASAARPSSVYADPSRSSSRRMEATQSAPLLASPSSSPTSPVSSSQSSDRIAAGAACSPVGHQRCVASGNSAEWATCDFGVWLVRSCGTGLICRDDQAPLVCDFPLDPTHQQMELYQAEIA